jgi:hypothetical protein
MSGSRTNVTRVYRTLTPNNPPPPGVLLDGELAVEQSDPCRIWIGVPTTVDPTGRRLLFDAGGPFVHLTGDAMVGPLVLSADAIAPLNPVSLRQMQAFVPTGAPFLPLSGGVMNGTLTLHANAGSAFEAVTLQQLQSTVGGSGFLPLTGGTINPGPLLVAPGATAARTLTLRGDTTGSIGETAVESGAIALRLGYTSTAGSVRVAVIGQENINAIEIKALSGAPVIFASGSGADVDLSIQGRGAAGVTLGSVNLQNRVRVVGASAGSDPSISAFGADTNIDLFIQGKGAGGVQLARTTTMFTPKGNLMLGMPEPANMSTSDGINGSTLRAWYTVANNYMSFMYYDGASYRRLNTNVPGQMICSGGNFIFQNAPAGAADAVVSVLNNRAIITYDGSLGVGGFTPTAGVAGLISSQNSVVGNAMGVNLYYDNANWRYRNNGTAGMWYMDTGGANGNMYLYLSPNGTAGGVASIPNPVIISTTLLTMNGNINATGFINAAGQDANHYGLTTPNGVWSNGTSWFNTCTGSQCTFSNVYANSYLYGAADGRVDGNWTVQGGSFRTTGSSNPCISTYNNSWGGAGFWLQSDGVCVFGQVDSGGRPYSGWWYSTGANGGMLYSHYGVTIDGAGGSGFTMSSAGNAGTYYYVNGLAGNPAWDWMRHNFYHFPNVSATARTYVGTNYWDFRNDYNITRGDGYAVSWYSISDIRIKKNIAPSTVDALDIIYRIPISEFDISAEVSSLSEPLDIVTMQRGVVVDDKHVDLGWVAQMVGAVLPSMDKIIMVNDTHDGLLPQDLHIVESLVLLPYLVRAMQQLTDRLVAVEGKL